MSAARRVPPAWVLSVPIATFGMTAGFVIVTLPQMLAALGVPGGHIAVAVAVVTSPGFWVFALAPFLDVRFRRRTYALVFGLLAVCATAFTVMHHPSQILIETVMTIGYLSLALYGAAVGGWTGALIEKDQNSKLGAWNTIFNICSGGLGVLLSGYFTQHFSPGTAAALVFVIFLAPMLTFFFIPAPPPDDVIASESFLRFGREVISLFKRRQVLVALAMFTLPSASFALTNTLGGWGKDFHASPAIVSLFGGVGGMVAGDIMDVYSSGLSLMAANVPLRRTRTVFVDAALSIAASLYVLLVAQDFLGSFVAFLSLLAGVLAPWAAVFWLDMALRLRRGYDVAQLYRGTQSAYGRYRWPAIFAWLAGTVVGLLATSVPPLLKGPLAVGIFANSSLGFFLGFLVSLVLYLPFALRERG